VLQTVAMSQSCSTLCYVACLAVIFMSRQSCLAVPCCQAVLLCDCETAVLFTYISSIVSNMILFVGIIMIVKYVNDYY